MKNIKIFIPFLLMLTLLLSACGTAAPVPTITPDEPAALPPATESGTPDGLSAATTPKEVAPLTVQVTAGSVTLSLPEGWVYEERPDDSQGWTLAFGPEEDTTRVLLRKFDGSFGVCGTGLTEVDLALQTGNTARVGYYDSDDCWSFVSFGNDWAAINDGAPDWSEQALAVLATVIIAD